MDKNSLDTLSRYSIATIAHPKWGNRLAMTVDDYRKEEAALTRKIEGGLVSGTKLRRIIARKNDILDRLIPELEGRLKRPQRRRPVRSSAHYLEPAQS